MMRMKRSVIYSLVLLPWMAACAQHVPEQPVAPDKPLSKPKKTVATLTDLRQYDASFLYVAAQAAMQDRHPALAIQFLQALNEKLSSAEGEERWSIEPRMKLAQLLLQQQRAKDSAAVLEPLVAHYPIQPEQEEVLRLHTLYARVLVAQGAVNDAIDALTRVLQLAPDYMPARELQITLLMQTKHWDLAHIAIQNGIRRQDSARLRLLDAEVYIEEKHYAQAQKALRQAQKLSPDDVNIVVVRSQVFLLQKKEKQAEDVLRTYVKKHPNQWRAKQRLAALYLQQEKWKKAIALYEALNQQYPEREEVALILGKLFYKKGELAKSEVYFEQAYRLHPQGDGYAFYLAAVLDAQGKDKQAYHMYEAVASTDSMWRQAQLSLASLDLKQRSFAKVRKRMRELLKTHPNEAHAWVLLSAAYLNEKKYQELLDATEAGVRVAKPSPRLMMNRAIAQEHFKQYEAVESTLKAVLKTHPEHAEALNFLGYTYAEQGIKLKQAEQYILRALKLKPDDAYYMDSLAWVYYQQGQWQQAIALQRKALKRVSDDATMQEHLGDMLWKAGEHQAAILQWKRALTLQPEFPEVLRQKIAHGL